MDEDRSELPPLRAVQVFEAVARTGSVTRAAVELKVSAGAVSQQIHKLEALLDLPLFERRGKGLELSSWGLLYQRELTAVFAQLRQAHEALERARRDSALVISCLSSVAAKWLGLRLLDWQARHPEARLNLVGAEQEPDLARGQADMRITYGQSAQRHARSVALHTDWVVPACAPALLGGRASLAPEQVLALPRIGIEWERGRQPLPDWSDWARTLGMAGAPSQPPLGFSLASAAIDAALAGRGVVLAPAGMLDADLRSGRLCVPFDHRLPLPEAYFLAWDPAALRKPHARALHQWLRDEARRQGARSEPAQSRD